MVWRSSLWPALLGLLLLSTACGEGAFKYDAEVDWQSILECEVYDRDHGFRGPEKDFMLLVYVPDVHCRTCVDENIASMIDYYERKPENLEFLFLTYSPDVRAGRKDPNLVRLRRVARLRFPVLLEPTPGFSGFEDVPAFYLVDSRSNRAVLRYAPIPEADSEWHAFERSIADRLIPGN